MSTEVPKLEKEALASVAELIAPTVMAVGAEAGEVRPASCCRAFLVLEPRAYYYGPWSERERLTFSFPAATTTKTPTFVNAAIAEFKAADFDPPIEMFITAFPAKFLAVAFVATKFSPLITPELVPAPSASRTLTATSETALATPYAFPPIVPAT